MVESAGLAYEPHGKRRTANWTDAAGMLAAFSTDLGYTDHEHLDEVGLIHMNGRIYDPTLGRFLSADPTVQFPEASQSLNRYSYVLNNPLSFTDPTGHFPNPFKAVKSVFKAIGSAVRWIGHNWRMIASIAVTAVGWQFGLTGAFIGGFTSGLIASGGDFRVGLISAITAAAFYEVGGMNFKGLSIGKFSYGKVFAHGVVGGVSSELQGGRLGSGFLSAGFTQAVAQTGAFEHLPGDPEAWSGRASATAAAAVVGGTAGVVGGGKFANGAVTGAFAYAFGRAAHAIKEARQEGSIYVTGHRVGKVGPYRLAIEYDGQTLSAGPVDGLLFSELNRAGDEPTVNLTIGEVRPPTGMSAGTYFSRVQQADLRYCDCVDYDLFPGVANSYNSNSYVHGLINATGGTSSVNFSRYFGGPEPLPPQYFGVP